MVHSTACSSITVLWMLCETASVSVIYFFSHLGGYGDFITRSKCARELVFLFLLFCFIFSVRRQLDVVTQRGWSDPPADLLVLFMEGSG